MKNSLSLRILVASSVMTCAILVLAGVLLLFFLRLGLAEELDRRLLHTAQNLTTTVEQVNGRIIFEWEGIDSGPISIFRVYELNGKIVAQSTNGPSIDHPITNSPVDGTHEFISGRLTDGSACRIARLSFVPFQENDAEYENQIKLNQIPVSQDIVVLEVAFPINDLESTMRLATWLWIAGTLAASMLTPLLLWPIIRTALKPVRSIATQIEKLDAGSLRHNFKTTACPQELLPITSTLERLLSRLEQAFEREKQITANLAHELKTPLAGLSATLEPAASKPRTAESYQQTVQKCRSIVSDLIVLSERILQLARLESNQINIATETIELQQLFEEVAHDLELLYPDRPILFEIDSSNLPTLCTDRVWLKQILINLCQNAVEHGQPGTPISIESVASPFRQISITNACTSLDPLLLTKLKDRFFQLDANRSKTGKRFGLGLSICDHIANRLGATLQLQQPTADKFSAFLRWPDAQL